MPVKPVDLAGKKILVTGVNGQVARPLVGAWSKIGAEVYAMGRYGKEEDRTAITQLGGIPVKADLADPASLKAVPDDVDYVVNCAVVKMDKWDYDFAVNAEGVGHLMARTAKAKGWVHFSTTGVYEYAGGHAPRKETDNLADNHRSMMLTYSLSKIAGESVAKFAAKHFGIPTTIARLCVPYGDNGGWPYYHLLAMQGGHPIDVHPDRPNYYSLLHIDDYVEKVPYLLNTGSPDATVVNFGGSEVVAIEEWCEYLGELTGLKPVFRDNPKAFGSLAVDTTRMHELIGPTKVTWKQGIQRMVKALAPNLLKAA